MSALGSVYAPDIKEYYNRIYKVCKENDILLIFDEVNNGFGRTGKLFAYEHTGIRPDMFVFGKGITSGYAPLGATVVSKEIAEIFRDWMFMHGYTFEGHPASAAAAITNINIIVNEKLYENADNMGNYLRERLGEITEFDIVGDVIGLHYSIEYVSDKNTKKPISSKFWVAAKIEKELLKNGVYSARASVDRTYIAPPLIINKDQIDFIINAIKKSIRFKNYIQYKQYGALEIVIKQELGTNKLDENLVSIYFFDDQKKMILYYNIANINIPLDLNSLPNVNLVKKLIKVSNKRYLLVYIPIQEKIISDIQEERTIGYLITVFSLENLDKRINFIYYLSFITFSSIILIYVFFLSFLISQIYLPINYLNKIILEIKKQRFKLEEKKFLFREFSNLQKAFIEMGKVIEQQLIMLEALASNDALTTVYNRRAFEKFYNAMFIKNNMYKSLGLDASFSVIMIDIDNFKKINDTYGHDIGDKVLRGLGTFLNSKKRRSDIVARYGGEEFVIILSDTDKIDALKFVINLIENIKQNIKIEIDKSFVLSITVSVGIAVFPYDSENKHNLIKIADENLYYTKTNGKDGATIILNNSKVLIRTKEELENLLNQNIY
jgi:diguanylate cyclase (GGDEF)-like protein